jgi:hypothetical protein
VALSGAHAYVVALLDGLQVVDITDPVSPRIVGRVGTPGSGHGVAVAGTHAYVAADWSGLEVFDISDPSRPRIVGNVPLMPGWAEGVVVSEDYVYIADGGSGLRVLPAQCEPSLPELVAGLEALPAIEGIRIHWRPIPDYFEAFYIERARADQAPPDYLRLNPSDPIPGNGPGEFLDTAVRPEESYIYSPVGVTSCEVEKRFGPLAASVPTPVLVAPLEAVPSQEGISIRWRAIPGYFEAFYIERTLADLSPADDVRLNRRDPIPGDGPWEFLDADIRPGWSYTYSLVGVTSAGEEERFGPVTASMPITHAALRGVFPNPASGRAWIDFDLLERTELTISVHDLMGRLVATVIRGWQEAGARRIRRDACDEKGRGVAPGIYFITMETSSGTIGHSALVITR